MLNVYVSNGAIPVASGSALVARPHDAGATDTDCYFEGNIYNAENMRCFEAKAYQAASRLLTSAPTVARARLPLARLTLVGHMVGTSEKDMHFELAEDAKHHVDDLANAITTVRAVWPDVAIETGAQAERRLRTQLRLPAAAVKHVTIPHWCLFSATAVTPSNPSGYLGGGDYCEIACNEALNKSAGRLRSFRIDAGNSTEGTAGFVAHVQAYTRAHALHLLRERTDVDGYRVEDDKGFQVVVFLNPAGVTEADVEEADE